ncbi:hypothetical protein sscle_04g039480 [Sclerotinia sclerotiorum 1980 UF-70]|uniref:Heterokaryon incompatibility domain-containing protein n=1 Tax=Sclerotinia sclerotiorum (strain ATCC 18683 / 1980 / Ss-1) TaxID=665079 RepID=A0A1D9Q2K0_SCLS1|nr:hypothetical protein sscle_04g039480 [Sclerotinia sclerotiorum 1980 UF-70]
MHRDGMAKSRYQYKPLNEFDSIRLLVLQPSVDITTNIHCTLVTTTLTKCENDIISGYTALSYVWGDARVTKSIYIDNKTFEVTANLDSALRHLRDSSRGQLLWVDAICIDQTNDNEKSKQVVQIGRVYQVARNTVIYLGESTESSKLLLQVIQRSHDRSLDFQNSTAMDKLAAISKSMDLDKVKDLFLDILERPWFTRIWVLQELIFSANPWVQCGQLRVKWKQLFNAFETISISISGSRPSRLHESLGRFVAMNQRRDTFKLTRKPSDIPVKDILELLTARRGLGVSDPRDMLFAHKGILQGSPDVEYSQNMALVVDYSRSVKDVYTNLARYCIETSPDDRKLEVLSHIEGGKEIWHKEKELDLPSWTPDWTLRGYPRPYRYLREMVYVEGGTGSSACRRKRKGHYQSLQCWWLKSSFVCSGWSAGTISKTSRAITPVKAAWKLQKEDFLLSLPQKDSIEEVWTRALTGIYNRWCSTIEPLYHDIDLSEQPLEVFLRPRLPLTSMFTKSGLGLDVVKEIASTLSLDDLHSFKGSEDFLRSSITTASRLASTLSIILWAHAVIENGEISKTIFSEVLYNRKFATLEDGTLTLVPAAARKGDVICFLAADLTTPFLLRPKRVRFADLEKENKKHLSGVSETSYYTYSDYKFVGECHIDTPCYTTEFKSMHRAIDEAHSRRIKRFEDELAGELDGDTSRRLEIFPIS